MEARPDEKSSLAAYYDTPPGAFPETPTPESIDSPVLVSSQLSLSQAVYKRRSEYTVKRAIKIKVGTWNVAALPKTELDIKSWFVDGKGVSERLSGLNLRGDNDRQGESSELKRADDQDILQIKGTPALPDEDPAMLSRGQEIGLYVLGLQEIVDIASAAENLRPYNDPHPARKWKQAVTEALPSGYVLVAEEQLLGLYILVYAAPAIAPSVSHVSTSHVGTGLMGWGGNKGAVTVRIVLGEITRLLFVNCHLSAGVDKGQLERRNWDAAQIVNKTKLHTVKNNNSAGPTEDHHESIGDEDVAFWFGDLNYRLEGIPGEDVRHLLMLHTRGEYGRPRGTQPKIPKESSDPNSAVPGEMLMERPTDKQSDISAASPSLSYDQEQNPSADPTSLQTTLSSLLTHDQLLDQIRQRKAFHDGWREGTINFLPTYKYDVGSVGMLDSSEKRRGPSWCDRILFRTSQDKLHFEKKIEDEAAAKRKDDELKQQGVLEAASDEAVLFDYDPDTDAADKEDVEPTANPEILSKNEEDHLHMEYYTSHQHVLSSDHKPLDAVFTFTYNAVDADLKAHIHQEVARELDKAENEGRPIVTVVIDQKRQPATQINMPSDPEYIDFGDVRYDHAHTRHITIANTGAVVATVGFVDRPVDASQSGGVAPPWLHIKFDRQSDIMNANPGALQEYSIQPGDAADVELSLHIKDIRLVQKLNEHQMSLDDILVLRIHNGRDYFLPVRGQWLQSAFGRSIEKLVTVPAGGVRRLKEHFEETPPAGAAVTVSAPRELFQLIDAIERLVERAVGEWNMIMDDAEPPWLKELAWPFAGKATQQDLMLKLKNHVREGLDNDTSFDDHWPPEVGAVERLEATAETLLDFICSLQGRIITESTWAELERGIIEQDKAKRTLSRDEEQAWVYEIIAASGPRSVAFTLLVFMLSNVANEIMSSPTYESSSARASVPSSPIAGEKSHDDHQSTETLRSKIDAAYAAVFADIIFELPEDMKPKVKVASEGRRRRLIQTFLPAQDNDLI